MNIKTRSAIVLSFLIVGITTQCNSAAIRVSKRRSGTSTHSKSLVKPATLFSDITNPAERLLTPKPPIDIFHSKQQCLTRKLPLMGHHFPLTMESIRGGGKNIENIINIIKLADNPFFLPQPITTEALCFWAKGIGKQFSVIPPLNEGLYRHRNFIPFKQLAYIERAFERWQKIFPGACRHIAFNLYHLKNIIRVQLEGIKKIEQETVLCVLPFFEEAVRLSHDYLSHGESTTSKAISLIGYIYDCDTLTTSQKVSHTHDVIKSFLNKEVIGRSHKTPCIVNVRIAKHLTAEIGREIDAIEDTDEKGLELPEERLQAEAERLESNLTKIHNAIRWHEAMYTAAISPRETSDDEVHGAIKATNEMLEKFNRYLMLISIPEPRPDLVRSLHAEKPSVHVEIQRLQKRFCIIDRDVEALKAHTNPVVLMIKNMKKLSLAKIKAERNLERLEDQYRKEKTNQSVFIPVTNIIEALSRLELLDMAHTAICEYLASPFRDKAIQAITLIKEATFVTGRPDKLIPKEVAGMVRDIRTYFQHPEQSETPHSSTFGDERYHTDFAKIQTLIERQQRWISAQLESYDPKRGINIFWNDEGFAELSAESSEDLTARENYPALNAFSLSIAKKKSDKEVKVDKYTTLRNNINRIKKCIERIAEIMEESPATVHKPMSASASASSRSETPPRRSYLSTLAERIITTGDKVTRKSAAKRKRIKEEILMEEILMDATEELRSEIEGLRNEVTERLHSCGMSLEDAADDEYVLFTQAQIEEKEQELEALEAAIVEDSRLIEDTDLYIETEIESKHALEESAIAAATKIKSLRDYDDVILGQKITIKTISTHAMQYILLQIIKLHVLMKEIREYKINSHSGNPTLPDSLMIERPKEPPYREWARDMRVIAILDDIFLEVKESRNNATHQPWNSNPEQLFRTVIRLKDQVLPLFLPIHEVTPQALELWKKIETSPESVTSDYLDHLLTKDEYVLIRSKPIPKIPGLMEVSPNAGKGTALHIVAQKLAHGYTYKDDISLWFRLLKAKANPNMLLDSLNSTPLDIAMRVPRRRLVYPEEIKRHFLNNTLQGYDIVITPTIRQNAKQHSAQYLLWLLALDDKAFLEVIHSEKIFFRVLSNGATPKQIQLIDRILELEPDLSVIQELLEELIIIGLKGSSQLSMIKKLLAKYPEVANGQTVNGHTPLMDAILLQPPNQFEIVRKLLQTGADPNKLSQTRGLDEELLSPFIAAIRLKNRQSEQKGDLCLRQTSLEAIINELIDYKTNPLGIIRGTNIDGTGYVSFCSSEIEDEKITVKRRSKKWYQKLHRYIRQKIQDDILPKEEILLKIDDAISEGRLSEVTVYIENDEVVQQRTYYALNNEDSKEICSHINNTALYISAVNQINTTEGSNRIIESERRRVVVQEDEEEAHTEDASAASAASARGAMALSRARSSKHPPSEVVAEERSQYWRCKKILESLLNRASTIVGEKSFEIFELFAKATNTKIYFYREEKNDDGSKVATRRYVTTNGEQSHLEIHLMHKNDSSRFTVLIPDITPINREL